MPRPRSTSPNDRTANGSATLQQVAEQAGVSMATASRVLNGSSRTVNAELSERVRAAAARLRYVSNGPAQALARATTSLVGLLVHDVGDPYFSTIAAGAMRVAREHDLLVMVASTYREPALEADYVARLGAQRARAILLAGSPSADPAVAEALSEKLSHYLSAGGRVVCIGDQGPGIDSIVPGNFAGALDAARHLAGLGHRRIGVITGPDGLVTVTDRLAGFHRGLTEGGFAAARVSQVGGDFTRDGGYRAMQQLLATEPTATAVFALNDLMAVGALVALREAGRRVPEDVSVVGFDDLPLSQDVTPALTTIHLDLESMGEQAMRLVVNEPGPDEATSRRVVHVQTSLVIRESTASVAW
jgi:LacI family transcriptional regulator